MLERMNTGTFRDRTLVARRLVVGYGFIAHGAAKWGRGPEHFGKLLHQIGAPFPTATAGPGALRRSVARASLATLGAVSCLAF